MAIESWKLWLVPLSLWGLYLCWHTGYQSGYADGHETAWRMSRPAFAIAASETTADQAVSPPLESDSLVRN